MYTSYHFFLRAINDRPYGYIAMRTGTETRPYGYIAMRAINNRPYGYIAMRAINDRPYGGMFNGVYLFACRGGHWPSAYVISQP